MRLDKAWRLNEPVWVSGHTQTRTNKDGEKIQVPIRGYLRTPTKEEKAQLSKYGHLSVVK